MFPCQQLYVVATDNGIVRRSAFISVRVTVVRNRNGPIFSASRYNVTINENIATQQSVVRIAATDADGVSMTRRKKSINKPCLSSVLLSSRYFKKVIF
jgi:hypothetical protein